jgi:hypothetical protein
MRSHIAVAVISVLCLSLFSGYSAPAEQKITVLSPMGTPPPIKLIPMAPRLTTLDGKTIYVVDQGFPGSENLIREIVAWFEKNMPKTNAIFKKMAGGPVGDDPALWAEIKQKGDAVIMGTGH